MEEIAVDHLRIGMYVSDLDRPWLGTPFLMQGFLIEERRQIEQLRGCCATVLVDPRRSIIPIPTQRPCFEQDAAERDTFAAATTFLTLLRSVQGDCRQKRPLRPPAVLPGDGGSRLEEELVYSAPLYDDTVAAIQQLMQWSELDEKVDIENVSGHVKELAASVERNPDALVWLTRLKHTDHYTYDHAIEVAIHLMVFGQFVGMDRESIERLGLVGLLQDIGKIHLPPDLLSKEAKLTSEEFDLVRSHVGSSLELLLGQTTFDRRLLEVVARHHERHDGSGYPRRLKGDKIGLQAEMAGLIDTFCAMIRHRPYGEAVSNQQALGTLVQMRGTKFRAAIVDQFVQCVGLYPVGTLVELNTGEVAVVIQKNRIRRLQPKLLVLLAPDKTPDRKPRTLDLLLDPLTPTGTPYRITTALPMNAYGIDPREFYLA